MDVQLHFRYEFDAGENELVARRREDGDVGEHAVEAVAGADASGLRFKMDVRGVNLEGAGEDDLQDVRGALGLHAFQERGDVRERVHLGAELGEAFGRDLHFPGDGAGPPGDVRIGRPGLLQARPGYEEEVGFVALAPEFVEHGFGLGLFGVPDADLQAPAGLLDDGELARAGIRLPHERERIHVDGDRGEVGVGDAVLFGEQLYGVLFFLAAELGEALALLSLFKGGHGRYEFEPL